MTSLIEKSEEICCYLPATKDQKFPAEAAQLQEHLLKCKTHKAISSLSGTSNAAKLMAGPSQCHPKDPKGKDQLLLRTEFTCPNSTKAKEIKKGPTEVALGRMLVWWDLG